MPRLEPSYEQKAFSLDGRNGKLLPIAVPVGKNNNGASDAVQIHQDATIYTSLLAPGESVTHRLAAGRRAYVFVIKGDLLLNGKTLQRGRSGARHRRARTAALHGSGSGLGTSRFPAPRFAMSSCCSPHSLEAGSLRRTPSPRVKRRGTAIHTADISEESRNRCLSFQFVACRGQAVEPLPQRAIHRHDDQ